MSMDVFAGALAGLGEALTSHNQNLIAQEMDRRKMLAGFWQARAMSPEVTPEGQEIATRTYLGIMGSPFDKRLPKEFDEDALNRFMSVTPRVGMSLPAPQPQAPQQMPGTAPVPPQPLPTNAGAAYPADFVGPLPGGINAIPGGPTAAMPGPTAPSAALSAQGPNVMTRLPQVAPPVAPPFISQETLAQQPRSPYWSPQEKAQMAAQAAGMQAEAIATAQEPSKVREAEAKAQAALELWKTRLETEAFNRGMRITYDAQDKPHMEPIPKDQLPEVQRSIAEKNEAATKKVEAETGLVPIRQQLLEAQTAYQKSRSDPNSLQNQELLARIKHLGVEEAIQKARLGQTTEEHLARYWGKALDGSDLPGAPHDEFGNPIGSAYARFWGATAATLTASQKAMIAKASADDLIQFASADANKNVFGKLAGRYAELMAQKIGTEDPRFSTLEPMVASLASLLVGIHGFRGGDARDEFMRTLNQADSPDAFIAAVKKYRDLAQQIQELPKQIMRGGSNAPPGTATGTSDTSFTYNGRLRTFPNKKAADDAKRALGIPVQ